MKWRVIPWGRHDAYTNMAIDQAIAESVSKGAAPTIRFYTWQHNGAVSIGRSQKHTDVDLDVCKKNGIELVKRATGGRALYHSGRDLTYSIAVPSNMPLFKDKEVFTQTSYGWLMNSLELLGVKEVEWKGGTSLFSKGKKISGNAQDMRDSTGCYFQHGSIFVDLDYKLLSSLYKVSESELREKTTSLGRIVTSLNHIYDEFQSTFLQGIDYEEGPLTATETKRVEELVRTRYKTDAWTTSGMRSKGSCSMQWGERNESLKK